MSLILSKEVQKCAKNKYKPSVSEDFRQKSSASDVVVEKNFASDLSF